MQVSQASSRSRKGMCQLGPHENSLQIPMTWEQVVCGRRKDGLMVRHRICLPFLHFIFQFILLCKTVRFWTVMPCKCISLYSPIYAFNGRTERFPGQKEKSSSSPSSSNPKRAGSTKASICRRSFFVGRPVPRALSTNPLIRLISSSSYCLASVTFS